MVHLLEGTTIRTTVNPEASPPVFTTVPVTGITSNATCLEIMDGIYYIGTATGEIWIANADGTSVAATPPPVENRLPDAFGRGLAPQGDRAVGGAPEPGSDPFLGGRAEVWK